MHTSRYAIAGLALVASTIIVSCGSDDNSTPLDSVNATLTGSSDTTSGAGDTTLTSDSLAISDTSVVDTTLP